MECSKWGQLRARFIPVEGIRASLTWINKNSTATHYGRTLYVQLVFFAMAAPRLDTASAPPQPPSPPTERQAVFTLRGVAKTYTMGEVKVAALKDVDLDLYQGEFIVLLGASGSGKSTLLNILGGLDTPSAGTLAYLDHDLTHAGDAALTKFRREHVGFVFQFYNLIPSLTALENVQLVTEISPQPMDPLEALRLVGLADRVDHFPAQLSGGEQQRVAIARAIAKQPDILLCDEPTGALDFRTGKLVLEVLDRINRELGTTTAIITHNAAIAGMAHRVVSISSGSITRVEANAHRLSPSEIEW
jgi:putative ABC transport system ATP-binding protein